MSLDYSRWNTLLEEDSDLCSPSLGHSEQPQLSRNLRIILSNLHYKATELFSQAESNSALYSEAEAAYREIVHHVTNSPAEILQELEGQDAELLVSSFLNILSCLIKQNRHKEVVTTSENLTTTVENHYPDHRMSIDQMIRLSSFRVHALLSIEENLHNHYIEATKLLQSIKHNLSKYKTCTDFDKLQRDHNHLSSMLEQKRRVLIMHSEKKAQLELQTMHSTILDYMKNKEYKKVLQVLLVIMHICILDMLEA
jgi:hypothetical protein